MAEEKTPDQIPWAERVKVTDQSDLSVGLEYKWQPADRLRSKWTADIWHKDFEWSVSKNSKIEIEDYMDLDPKMTNEIHEWWEEDLGKNYGQTYKDRVLRYLQGGVREQRRLPVGPKEWSPGKKRIKIKAELTDTYGYGNTYNEDPAHWWGDVFEFGHFTTAEGDEGAVILWQGGGDPRGNYHTPQVYLGQFEDFMDSQYEHSPWDVETFLRYNGAFENGFMWAWEKMGVFDGPEEKIADLNDRHVKQALGAIQKDPSILLPESVQKIIEKFDEFPSQIQKAVTWLMGNKRRELEKALGQKLIWGDLYGG